MISRIEALNFRSLRYISQPLDAFHILVGPNASGKTTFLDVISFLNRLVSDGLEAAVNERAGTFRDLLWHSKGDQFELAVEAKIPTDILEKREPSRKLFDALRYEVAISIDSSDQVAISEERAFLEASKDIVTEAPAGHPKSLMSRRGRYRFVVVNKARQGNDYFHSENTTPRRNNGWRYAFKLGPQKSALGSLPDDKEQFPATLWFRDLLTTGVQPLILNSLFIRRASPPSHRLGFRPDGSNLPWVVENLRQKSPERFEDWLAHLQTALPDIENIRTVERADDRHRYLLIKYKSGLEIPSWVVSDGTLRLLALTLPAYLSELKGIYLIEEPENGIHPRAVETVFQSLSSVYDAQILLASHSPVILSAAKAEQVLCFSKANGATSIVAGHQHPALKDWQGETNLGVLFASGVLG